MSTTGIIIASIAIAIVVGFNVYIVYDFIQRYKESTEPNLRKRILDAARGSLTILVLKIGTIFWSSILALSEFGDLIAMPEVKLWLNDTFGPRVSSGVSLIFLALAYTARIRRMSQDPVNK